MKYLPVLLLLLIFGCEPKTTHALPIASASNTGELIPIDFTDTLYDAVADYARDTITKDGWKISYFVKNDTTRYNDLYIQWEKGTVKRLYQDTDVLQMRRYFIPGLSAENKTHIFLEHGCATGCGAVLVLPKDGSAEVKDFDAVFGYDTNFNQIVCRDYDENDSLSVSVTNFKSGVTRSVTYKNKPHASLVSYITPLDTLIFKSDRVILDCEVYDMKQDKYIIERQVIKF